MDIKSVISLLHFCIKIFDESIVIVVLNLHAKLFD